MHRVARCAFVLPALLATSCVGGGLIYQHTTTPLDVNLDSTPVFDSTGKGNTKEFQYYVDFQWDSNGIGDIVKKSGFAHADYADITVLSILGIWQQVFVTVYGS